MAQRLHYATIEVAALLAAGLVFGAAIGRWWALLGAVVVLGVALGLISELEVSRTFVGVASRVVSGFAIAIGVLVASRSE